MRVKVCGYFMHTYLINKIQEILESVPQIKEIFNYPVSGTPKKSPAVIFVADAFENRFEDTRANFKTYRFKLWLWINIAGSDEKKVFSDIMPKTVDALVAKFDSEWNGGTVEGHRIWQVLDTGKWELVITDKSKTAVAEMTLTVKTTTTD